VYVQQDLDDSENMLDRMEKMKILKLAPLPDINCKLDNLEREINDLVLQLSSGEDVLQSLNHKKTQLTIMLKEIGSLSAKHDQMVSFNERWDRWHDEWNVLNQEIRDITILQDACHRDGFPTFFTTTLLRDLEDEMNCILDNFIDRRVRFCYENDNLVFQTISSDSISGLNYYGGMESFMLDIAIKIVFSKYNRVARPTLFILDENISVLDEDRLRSIDTLFEFLRKFFSDILIISHQPFLLDIVDDSILIRKDANGYSFIQK
jgi:DNA repair exonuclease SbcCD ATPase subunit